MTALVVGETVGLLTGSQGIIMPTCARSNISTDTKLDRAQKAENKGKIA